MSNTITKESYFASNVFFMENTNYLDVVSEITEELLSVRKKEVEIDALYPAVMTDNFYGDERAKEFCGFIGDTCWSILDSEGYAMDKYYLYLSEMWAQEHHRYSSMERHTHGNGAQLSGFYFLETPENCSRVVVHDPRSGKVQINLLQKNQDIATDASEMVNFLPKPGMLLVMASSLPHSFTRHASEKPLKFVHFNLGAGLKPFESQQSCAPKAEVI